MRRLRIQKAKSKIDPEPVTSSINEGSDDDAPVALNFKDVEQERIKTEKAIKASILASKKTKTKLRRKDVLKKSVHFAYALDTAKNMSELPENKETEEDVNEVDEQFEAFDDEDNAETFEEFVGKPNLGKPGVTKAKYSNSEFELADTFDFRKYLPENILKEDGLDEEIGSEFDSEEELATAFLEGNYNDESDDGIRDKDESRNTKRKKEKDKRESRTTPALPPGPGKSVLNRRKRGGRRFRKMYSATPRVVIPSRQNTASLIRKRTEAFVKERLFGSPKMKGPRRMTREEMARSNIQLRARRMSFRNL